MMYEYVWHRPKKDKIVDFKNIRNTHRKVFFFTNVACRLLVTLVQKLLSMAVPGILQNKQLYLLSEKLHMLMSSFPL